MHLDIVEEHDKLDIEFIIGRILDENFYKMSF